MPRPKSDVVPSVQKTLTIMQQIAVDDWVYASQLEKLLGMSLTTVNKALAELTDNGVLERKLEYFGNKFNGHGIAQRGRLKRYLYRVKQPQQSASPCETTGDGNGAGRSVT